MAQPARIEIGDKRSGIVMEYTRRSNHISVWGFYDTFVGIEGDVMQLGDLMLSLKVPSKALFEAARMVAEIESIQRETKRQQRRKKG